MDKATRIKLVKTIKGAAIAAGGVFFTYLLQAVSQMDFGPYTAVAVGLSSILINAVKEFFRTYEQ